MANPIAVAMRGKGFLPMVHRGRALLGRYGATEDKLIGKLKCMADTTLAFGHQATLPMTASLLARHLKLARVIRAQGMELAIHGLKHIDYTQLPLETQMSEFQQAMNIFSIAGLSATGFRSPYLRWNGDTLSALKACGFAYDSSQALAWDVISGKETSSYERALEFYGAQRAELHMALPRLQDGLVRIPYCLPDDEALLERLHLQGCQAIVETWLVLLDCVYEGGELFTLGLHPERASLCQKALWAVLEKAHSLSPRVWIASLEEIARWQRLLAQATFQARRDGTDGWQIVLQAGAEAFLLARKVDILGPAQAWTGQYRQIFNAEVSVRSDMRPWIGLSPDCPASLGDFLRQQGYLVEIGADPGAYSYYLCRSAFNPEDERPLLAEIEMGSWPLVRIARWPSGAKAALAITGDVDAFTLWDYGRRIFYR